MTHKLTMRWISLLLRRRAPESTETKSLHGKTKTTIIGSRTTRITKLMRDGNLISNRIR
jgi:hypothetical protein